MVSANAKAKSEYSGGCGEDYFQIMRNHYWLVVEGTNINPASLLTTDYLNHFSAVIMLIEMLPAAGEDFMNEITSWRPLSYKEHFSCSGFRDRELAIAAYDHAPQNIRKAFDHATEALQELSVHLIRGVRGALEEGRIEELTRMSEEGLPQLREWIDHAAAVVNGYASADTLAVEPASPGAEETGDAQAAIDELFG